MNKNTIITFLSCCIIAAALIAGCAKDKGKSPAPDPGTTTGSTTGTPGATGCDTVTYAKHIKPITDTYCAVSGCHNGSNSNPPLISYETVKDRADAGRIKIRAIDPNPSPMPPSSHPNQLTAMHKQLLTCWLENGKKP